ncbi:MAG: hypothetical protein IK080_07340 [Clostridia bacterium]|nr:hypothetical protein [Clostridia bacterium]MBR4727687.1 hypothetical protein [Clostridia bacterium]
MKKFSAKKLVYLGSGALDGAKTETYSYGGASIYVSKVRDLVSDADCLVIAFDRLPALLRGSGWKQTVADHFGLDLGACRMDHNVIYGRAV